MFHIEENRKELNLVLPLPVSVNHYLNHRVSGGKGKKFIQTYKTPEAIYFEKQASKIMQEEIKKQNWTKPNELQHVVVEVIWFFPKKGMDADNHFKMLQDQLQKNDVLYNDSLAMGRTLDMYIDTVNPHCEVKIYIAEKQGLFKNNNHKKYFCENNCYLCSKKKDNCTTFKKILENRIISDVDIESNKCNKIKIKKLKK